MRLKGWHRLGALAVYLSVHLGVAACSSSTQQQEGEEVSSEEEATEGNSADASSTEEGSDNFAEGEDAGSEGNMGDNLPADGGEEIAAAETQNNNLQGIISDMNAGNAEQPTPEAVPAETIPAPAEMPVAEETTPAPAAVESTPAAVASVPASQVAAPTVGNLPEMGSKMPYVVQPGDTLGKIAQKVYGDISFWKEIRDLTSMQNPSRIYPGDVVYYRLEEKSMNFAQSYENQAKSEVVVAKGETLHAIAKRLGDAKMWRQLWRLNDSVENPDVLNVGQNIYYYSNNQTTFNQTIESNEATTVEQVELKVNNVQDTEETVSSEEVDVFAATADWMSNAFAG